MAYIFFNPSELILLFYRWIYPKFHDGPCDSVVPDFFQRPENKKLQVGLERRLAATEWYAQYLKDNDLFDKEDTEWEQMRQWAAEAEENLKRLRQSTEKVQEKLKRLDEERAARRGREKQR